MRRMLVFSQSDQFLFEIDPSLILSAVVTEQINGANSLDLSTMQVLARSNRIVFADGTGRWYEYVVMNDDSVHNEGKSAFGTYHAVWSVQYDLMTVYGEDVESGGEVDVGASVAMQNALNGTRRWSVGEVGVSGAATIEMFGNSAWERMQTIVSTYGGELEPQITVGFNKVTGRTINLTDAMGSQHATRRFEWKRDLTSIKRKTKEAPLCCRIIPVGKSQDVTIEDINDGVRYIEDAEAALAYRMPDGNGGYEYPTMKVKFDIDDDRELLDYATAHVTDYTRPVPTYEATVAQYAEAGMDYQGVSLGDVIQIVDLGFNPDVPLRLEGRIHKRVRNLLDESDVTLTIGDVRDEFSLSFQQIDNALESVRNRLDGLFDGSTSSTKKYLEWLTDNMNTFINSLGGWTYIVPGRGILTYSCEVSDPEVGAEAKALVSSGNGSLTEIRGGAVRIANSLTSSGDWDFRTILLPGHIAAEMITAAHLTAGFIGNATNGSYWDLDAGELELYRRYGYGSYRDGEWHYDGVKVHIGSYPAENSYGLKWGLNLEHTHASDDDTDRLSFAASSLMTSIYSNKRLSVNTSSSNGSSSLSLEPAGGSGVRNVTTLSKKVSNVEMYTSLGYTKEGTDAGFFPTFIVGANVSGSGYSYNASILRIKAGTTGVSDSSTVLKGSVAVQGTKSRVVDTPSYGVRELYCYETPSPMFGDIGSAKIGEDGLCYVSIDDIFSETVRTDYAYQVFLQPYGDGSLWVSERHQQYFVVEGTPGLSFGWECKARQTGYEMTRLEDAETHDLYGAEQFVDISGYESMYSQEMDYSSYVQETYEEATE